MSDPVTTNLLIIGGGPAGLSAARAFREHGGSGPVVMLSADPDAPYARPPLSKDYLRGGGDESELPMTEPGELAGLDVDRRADTATDLDPRTRTVRTAAGDVLRYRSCLLATGSEPVPLPVPGGDDPRVLHLRTLADARRLRAAAGQARSAIVVGSGFIGCEAAASLARRGLTVTLVTNEPGPQQARLGEQVAERITGWLVAEGVRIVTSATITAIEAGDDTSAVLIDGQDDQRADLVLVAAGVRQRDELAEGAGLATQDGRVVTDALMRTSAAGVLAAGDVALAYNAAAGRQIAVEHWGEALTMGEIAGTTAAGGSPDASGSPVAGGSPDADAGWSGAPGFWSQIGDHQLKYAAWGDVYERARLVDHGGGAFTVWYTGADGATVGVLTHDADDDYDRGPELVEKAAPPPV